MTLSPKDRLELLFVTYNTNANQLAKDLGKKRSQGIYDVLNGKVGISQRLSDLIISMYDNVNKSWLLTGEGSMFRDVEVDRISEIENRRGISLGDMAQNHNAADSIAPIILLAMQAALKELEKTLLKQQLEATDKILNAIQKMHQKGK